MKFNIDQLTCYLFIGANDQNRGTPRTPTLVTGLICMHLYFDTSWLSFIIIMNYPAHAVYSQCAPADLEWIVLLACDAQKSY